MPYVNFRPHVAKLSFINLAISEKQWFYPLKNLFSIHPDYETNKLELKQKLHDAVKLRLDADLKIGTSLSGGIDSSIIFTILNELEFSKDINKFSSCKYSFC